MSEAEKVLVKYLYKFGMGRHTAPAMVEEMMEDLHEAGFEIVKRDDS